MIYYIHDSHLLNVCQSFFQSVRLVKAVGYISCDIVSSVDNYDTYLRILTPLCEKNKSINIKKPIIFPLKLYIDHCQSCMMSSQNVESVPRKVCRAVNGIFLHWMDDGCVPVG